MNWQSVGRVLRIAFFLRVPLFTLALLASLGPISDMTSAHALLGNLFDMRDDAGSFAISLFVVAFASFLLAFTATTAINLTLHYGSLRFDGNGEEQSTAGRPQCGLHLSQRRPGLTVTMATLAAWSLVITAVVRTLSGSWWTRIAVAVLAFLAAVSFILMAKFVQLALTDPQVTPHPPPFLVFPAYRWAWLEKQFDSLYCWPPPGTTSALGRLVRRVKLSSSALSQWPFQVFQGAGQGYLKIIRTADGERLKLHSGHVFATSLAFLAFLSYLVVGWDKSNINAAPAEVPALAYVLLYLSVVCWALSALTFFFDRYRFPLLVAVAVLCALTASTPESDHFFRVETQASVRRIGQPRAYLSPADYLAERAKGKEHPPLIVVATPGGGIQAAAWTAEVLQGLDKYLRDDSTHYGFRNSVGMISSVSGGSLGSMIYAASFAGNIQPDCIAENARDSAMDEVAWGWTGPDVWRAVTPLFRNRLEIDRGWALEQKWAVINGLSPEPPASPLFRRNRPKCAGNSELGYSGSPGDDTYLLDWAAKKAAIPALIFNSTIIETGRHAVFSTTDFPKRNDPRGILNFYDMYSTEDRKVDVRVNTAARVSASFPFVAPAARPNVFSRYSPDAHFVDGGYFDNLGIDSLVGWLTAADTPERPLRNVFPKILIVEIRHFNPGAAQQKIREGWAFQIFAPFSGLLNVWNSSPTYRDKNELDLYMKSRAGMDIRSVTIPYCGPDFTGTLAPDSTEFQNFLNGCIAASGGNALSHAMVSRLARDKAPPKADCADQPLSWKLTTEEKECIDWTWNLYRHSADQDPGSELNVIKAFLKKGGE